MSFEDENCILRLHSEDKIRAVDAKFEAQKIVFGPFAFEAARCLIHLGILESIDKTGEEGITEKEILADLSVSSYSLRVLIEMGLSLNLIKILKNSNPQKYYLGKTGFFLLHDKMTKANMDFMHHVCYQGNYYLLESLERGIPEGLKVFGQWDTIYEGLSSLPDDAKRSWFAFDHFYSDSAFPSALNYVFRKQYKSILDIGGNTAKWALACMKHDPDVKVTIVDLPGQAEVARERIREAGYSDRIFIHETNVLKEETDLPMGSDAVWMSQFLDCFSLDEITGILSKVNRSVDKNCDVFVMEPIWDKQRYPAAAYSLHATSLYFTSMANGNSKMYGFHELTEAIEKAGFTLAEANHKIGPNDYSILRFRKSGY